MEAPEQQDAGNKKGAKKYTTCRFYDKKYPEKDELVVVEVVKVEENVPTVKLLEYNMIEGMITPNELTRAMQNDLHKALKIGRQEVVKVLRVDEEKGYIDLSKKQVHKSEEAECLDKFNKARHINSLFITLASQTETELEKLYETIVWPMYRRGEQPLEVLRRAYNDSTIIDRFGIQNPRVKELLLQEIKRRLAPSQLKIDSKFEVRCLRYEGIEAIKRALKEGEKVSKPNFDIKVRIIGSPLYDCTLTTQDKVVGLALIQEALDAIKKKILEEGGDFKLVQEPKVYGDSKDDDQDIAQEGQERAEEGGSGLDDDDEDSEVEGMGDIDEDDEEQKAE